MGKKSTLPPEERAERVLVEQAPSSGADWVARSLRSYKDRTHQRLPNTRRHAAAVGLEASEGFQTLDAGAKRSPPVVARESARTAIQNRYLTSVEVAHRYRGEATTTSWSNEARRERRRLWRNPDPVSPWEWRQRR